MVSRTVVATGTTSGAGNYPSASGVEIDDASRSVAFLVEVENAGVAFVYRWEGSLDKDAWKPVAYITDASDTLAVADTSGATARSDVQFLANPIARRYRYYRLVVVTNTGPVTFRAEIFSDN